MPVDQKALDEIGKALRNLIYGDGFAKWQKKMVSQAKILRFDSGDLRTIFTQWADKKGRIKIDDVLMAIGQLIENNDKSMTKQEVIDILTGKCRRINSR